MLAGEEYDNLFERLNQLCVLHEKAAFPVKQDTTLDSDLGAFEDVWQLLHTPATRDQTVGSSHEVLVPSSKQLRQQRKREKRRHKRCLGHEAREAQSSAVPPLDAVPDLGNDTSASDTDAAATSSDDELSKEVRLTMLRSSLDSATKSFRSASPIIPRRTRPSVRDRTISLHSKLARHFPQDDQSLLSRVPVQSRLAFQENRPLVSKLQSRTHIFIDSSNIYLGFQDLLQARYPAMYTSFSHKRPSMDLHALHTILERGRTSTRKDLVGSSPLLQSWSSLAALDYQVSILERVKVAESSSNSRKEQGVDELIHLKMMESILDSEPGIMVLASGDANIAQFSAGFYPVAIKALARGWSVEVVAFKRSINKLWLELDDNGTYEDHFTVIYLDDFIDELEE